MKSSKKFAKLISVILLVSMLLTSNSVGVWADGLEWEEPESQTDLQENPYGEQAAENTVWESIGELASEETEFASEETEFASEEAESEPEEAESDSEQDRQDAADNDGNENLEKDEQPDEDLPENLFSEDDAAEQEDENGELPASAFAEGTIEIPAEDYLYVNGESKVLTLEGEMAYLCLEVKTPGNFHVLSSGVDISLVIFDTAAEKVLGTYLSEYGLMDVPFNAEPGIYILGVTGSGEVEILVSDDAKTEAIYASQEESPDADPAEQSSEAAEEAETTPAPQPADATPAPAPETPAAEETEPSAEENAEESAEASPAPASDAAPPAEEELPPEPAFDSSLPVPVQAAMDESVSVLEILKDAGAPIDAVTYVSGDMEGRIFSSGSLNGDWLLTPYAAFDSISVTVRASDGTDYTVVFSCPDPASDAAPDESSADAAADSETPAAEAAEPSAEDPAEKSAVPEADAAPSEADAASPSAAASPADPLTAAEASDPAEDPAPLFNPALPITFKAETNTTFSLLAVLAEAGAPENVITAFTGDLEGRVTYVTQNNDVLLTPYLCFDSIELTVTATDYLAAEPAEVTYTVVLTNPDPDAPAAEDAAEAGEETAEPEADAEAGAESAAPDADTSPAPDADTSPVAPADFTIAVERRENNEIRLYPTDLTDEDVEQMLFQWQYSTDGVQWRDISGANSMDYVFILDDITSTYYWRLTVLDQ